MPVPLTGVFCIRIMPCQNRLHKRICKLFMVDIYEVIAFGILKPTPAATELCSLAYRLIVCDPCMRPFIISSGWATSSRKRFLSWLAIFICFPSPQHPYLHFHQFLALHSPSRSPPLRKICFSIICVPSF